MTATLIRALLDAGGLCFGVAALIDLLGIPW
jgi:hypothetical protein